MWFAHSTLILEWLAGCVVVTHCVYCEVGTEFVYVYIFVDCLLKSRRPSAHLSLHILGLARPHYMTICMYLSGILSIASINICRNKDCLERSCRAEWNTSFMAGIFFPQILWFSGKLWTTCALCTFLKLYASFGALLQFSGMWRRVFCLKFKCVSEERSASIFRLVGQRSRRPVLIRQQRSTKHTRSPTWKTNQKLIIASSWHWYQVCCMLLL